MTARQLEILQHALGLNQYGKREHGDREYSRNHFCAGGADEDTCRELVALGYMWEWHQSYQQMYPYFNCSVTDAGKEAVRRESPPPPKLTRGQQRYRRFLHADTGESFGEWLKYQARREHANS